MSGRHEAGVTAMISALTICLLGFMCTDAADSSINQSADWFVCCLCYGVDRQVEADLQLVIDEKRCWRKCCITQWTDSYVIMLVHVSVGSIGNLFFHSLPRCLLSSSATRPSISCSASHARTLSMTRSSASPPSMTSSRFRKSKPLRWSLTRC